MLEERLAELHKGCNDVIISIMRQGVNLKTVGELLSLLGRRSMLYLNSPTKNFLPELIVYFAKLITEFVSGRQYFYKKRHTHNHHHLHERLNAMISLHVLFWQSKHFSCEHNEDSKVWICLKARQRQAILVATVASEDNFPEIYSLTGPSRKQKVRNEAKRTVSGMTSNEHIQFWVEKTYACGKS